LAQPVKPDRPGEGSRAARVFVLPDAPALARAVAGRLWGIARERTAAGPVHVALSGGDTPRDAYAALAADPYRERFPWDAVHFWQVDERFVPPGDPRSNRGMIESTLISRAPVPDRNFHGIDTSLRDAAVAANAYEEELLRAVPSATGGAPRLDAIVLGIGVDGHTASLFPGAGSPGEGERLIVSAVGGAPPVPRVTMSLRLLNAAARILFVVRGEGKAQVLRDVVAAATGAPSRAPALPAALVAPRRGTVVFLVDEGASRLLPRQWREAG
jgi:6-phosphogluconolactonase